MKLRRRRLLLWLAGLALAAAIGYSLLPEPVEVDLVAATRGPLLVTVDEDGRTRIRQRYVVAAALAGRLSRIELPGTASRTGSPWWRSSNPRTPRSSIREPGPRQRPG
jgi:HlyD family secretion protein